MFLKSVRLDSPLQEAQSYLSKLGIVRALAAQPLNFHVPVTVITGENGVGKSTLIEALAVGMRLNPEGGSRHADFASIDKDKSVSDLHKYLTLVRSANPADAFFLRGESFYNLAGYYQHLGSFPEGKAMSDLLDMSHGQSLQALLERRFHSGGFLILDEPEAGLFILRQLEFMAKLYHLGNQGAQIIMATHSPVLMGIPGAEILEINESGINSVAFNDTEAVRAAREFVVDPQGVANYLIDPEQT